MRLGRERVYQVWGRLWDRGIFSCWWIQGPDFPDLVCSGMGVQKLRPNYGERKASGNWIGQGSLTTCL